MIDASLIATKVGTAAAAPAFKTFCLQWARRNSENAIIDFSSLDPEMEEAIEVLALDADKPGKALLDYVKGIISDRPSVFNKPVALQWIRTQRAQDLIKQAVKILINGQSIQQITEDAAAFYESFEDAMYEADGRMVFDYAVAFVALSISRHLTTADKVILSAIDGVAKRVDVVAASTSTSTSLSRELLDSKVEEEFERIRRGRFFYGFNVSGEAQTLVERLISGNLQGASDTVRSRAISMCIRWLSIKGELVKLNEMLRDANALAKTDEAVIAGAFISARTDWKNGIAALSPCDRPTRRTAALQIVLNDQKAFAAIEWFQSAALTINDIDSDGRFVLLSCYIQEGQWKEAFENASSITEEDLLRTPALQYIVAAIRVANLVPDDLKKMLLQGPPPLDAQGFPLADDVHAFNERRIAIRLMKGAAQSASEFGCVEAEKLAANFALWLELRDPSSEASARARLNELLSDKDQAVSYIPLGLSFGASLDLEIVEQALARNSAFLPDGNVELALSRLAIALNQKNEIECADYFARHRELIFRHLDQVNMLRFEARLLVNAGRFEQARSCIISAGELLSDEEREQLESLIADSTNQPSTADLEAAYAQTPSTISLANLVAHLSRQNYSSRFYELACELVKTTRTRSDAEVAARTLLKFDRHDELAEFLKEIPEIVEISPDLRGAWAWSCYRLGRFKEAEALVKALLTERDDANDRRLLVNIQISSGRWNELPVFVENEWACRSRRSSSELFIAAQLAAQINSTRLDELLRAAAGSAENDPNIFLGCYMTAVQAGLEDRESVRNWFERAAALSGDEGPVKFAPLAELVEQAPTWDHHVNDIWDKLRLGVAPLSIAAQMLRRPMLELQLAPMIANKDQPDPRKRFAIPAFSGARVTPLLNAASVALDGSSLVTLGLLKLVGTVIQQVNEVYIPHCTLSWLFEERQKLGFHQPSRIKAAHALTRLLSTNRLHRFSSALPPNQELSELIGDQLASMLADAMTLADDGVQRLVVRSSPVSKIGSFLGEAVELSEFSSVLCSCAAVIDKLAERGQLTTSEEEHARSYLAKNENSWPNEPIIENGAHLYLDDLSVSYLRTAGVLEKLHTAGLTTYISLREVNEAQALIDSKVVPKRLSQ